MMFDVKVGDLITPHKTRYMGFSEGEIELEVVSVNNRHVRFTGAGGTGTDAIETHAFHKRFKVVKPASLENK